MDSPLTLLARPERPTAALIAPECNMIFLCRIFADRPIGNRGPSTLALATLPHAVLKTASVYVHARPGESSGRYLKIK